MATAWLDGLVAGIEWASLAARRLAAAAVLAILLLVATEVTLRGAFGASTQIADEVGGYLNAAVVYLGIAYALRAGAFVRVEPVYRRLTGRWGTAVRWLIVLASLAYMVVTTGYMIRFVWSNYAIGIVSTSISETPIWLPQLPVLLGSVLFVLQLAAFLLRNCRDMP